MLELVTGDKLRKGDIISRGGFLWQVDHVDPRPSCVRVGVRFAACGTDSRVFNELTALVFTQLPTAGWSRQVTKPN